MADSAPVLLWIAGTDGLCTFFNKTWLGYTGRTLEQETGVGWAEGVHAADFDECMGTYFRAFRDRRAFEMVYRLRRADGIYRWMLDRGTPRFEADGAFAGFVGSCADITEQKLAQQRARLEAERSARAQAQVERLLYAASHDLQEPLRMMATFAHLLRDEVGGQLDATQRSYLGFVSEGATRMKTLVDELLDFGEARRGSDQAEGIELSAVVEEAKQNLRLLISECDAVIEAPEPLPRVRMNHVHAVRLFQNILLNALTFRSERAPRVVIRLEALSDGWLVSIADNGIGISEQDREHVFEMFTRLHPRGCFPGVGLGLSVCREIVERYGGTIWLESAEGEGTRVLFTLPAESQPRAANARTNGASPAPQRGVLSGGVHDKARLFDAAPVGVLAVDRAGRIAQINLEAERLFGYSPGELLRQRIECLVPEDLREGHADLRQRFSTRASARKMGEGRELLGRRKDGSTFPIEVGLAPIGVGDSLLIVCTVADRTEVVEIRRELEDKARALNASNQELERFAYSASHDLQEPLRMVSSFLQLLVQTQGEKLDAEALTYIDYAVDGAARMKQMTSHLMTLARVSAQGGTLQPTACAEVLQQALDAMQPLLQEADAVVEQGDLPHVLADAVQLRLVFQNLIENAVKYRTERKLRVVIEAEVCDGRCEIRVIDNGMGFDPAHAQRIFEPFQRLHGREHSAGSGLGLAIVRKIVERHGGRIWASSVPSEGSRFSFTLPCVGSP